MTDLLADTSGLISALGDSSKANRAGAQLQAMIESGGAATLLETLLPQMVGMEGVRSTGGQRMVAQLLSDATHNLGSDALSHLPRIVELTAHALGDGEASVRVDSTQLTVCLKCHIAPHIRTLVYSTL